jgi:SPP1 family predicted phage head-tail adaptor
MDIGTFNRRVTIRHLATGQDAIGQPTTTWQDFATGLHANIRRLNGVETIRAGAQTAVGTTSIRLRSYRTDITTAMRVLHGSVNYEITAVLPDEQGKCHVDLVCKVLT